MDFSDIKGRYKQIDNFPDYYITDSGEIYSKRLRGYETEPHLHKLTPKNPGNPAKYLNIILCNDDGQFTKSIHRLVAENFVPGYFDGAVVNHIDGNNRNNNAQNLEWITTQENVRKSYITSGITQTRNYYAWRLIDPEGNVLGEFIGFPEIKRYIANNMLDTSPSFLYKKRRSRGYRIERV